MFIGHEISPRRKDDSDEKWEYGNGDEWKSIELTLDRINIDYDISLYLYGDGELGADGDKIYYRDLQILFFKPEE